MPEPDDQELVARFRKGDAGAFDALVRRYQRSVFYLALRYVKNEADAKDVTQRALVQAFERLASLRSGNAFRTWVYRIAVNLALNLVRDRARSWPVGDDAATLQASAEEPATSAPEPGLQADQQRRLRAAIGRLAPQQRLVVELRAFEELPFAEVAAIAECSEDAAKVNFHHALKRLRELLAEGEGHE